MKNNSEIVLIIPAAGYGRRFGKLCEKTPKPMIKIWGKPILEHILRQAAKAGIKKVLLVAGYKKEKITGYFKDGKKLGLSIKYVFQEKPCGTAQAVALCADYFSEAYFLLQWADIIVPALWYKKILDSANRNLDGVLTLDKGDWTKGAAVMKDKNWRISRIIEKPELPLKAKWNNSGIAILSRKILAFLPKKSYRGREIALPEIIDRWLLKGAKIKGLEIPKNWYFDIKDAEIYRKIRKTKPPNFL